MLTCVHTLLIPRTVRIFRMQSPPSCMSKPLLIPESKEDHQWRLGGLLQRVNGKEMPSPGAAGDGAAQTQVGWTFRSLLFLSLKWQRLLVCTMHRVPRISNRKVACVGVIHQPFWKPWVIKRSLRVSLLQWCPGFKMHNSKTLDRIVSCTSRMKTTGQTRGRQFPHCYRSGTAISAASEELQRFLG